MNPKIRFALNCSCSNIVWVSKTDAGTNTECPACKGTIAVPPLSVLMKLPSVDASPLGIVLDNIQNSVAPFDGGCQICESTRSDIILPAQLDYVSKDDIVSPDSSARIESCVIPCYLCYGCNKTLSKAMWVGLAYQIVETFFHSIWLLVALVVATIVAFILPFIGAGFVIAVVWGVYQQLSRRKANPALLKHLDRVCGLGDIVTTAYYYKLKPLRRVRSR